LVQAEFKTHPRYRTSSEEGPDHEKMFTVEVNVHGKTFGEGRGTNKKQAEQEAARAALARMGKMGESEPASLPATADEPAAIPPDPPAHDGQAERE
jgi:ribonuclease-3